VKVIALVFFSFVSMTAQAPSQIVYETWVDNLSVAGDLLAS
jgi:hypothetical protein